MRSLETHARRWESYIKNSTSIPTPTLPLRAPSMALNGNYSSSLRTLLLLTVIVAGVGLAAGRKRPVHIPDELDDVVDDEEDEAWKEWGKKKSAQPAKFDPPPTDFAGIKLPEIQEEMLKRHTGPAFGFVKLRLGVRRSPVIEPVLVLASLILGFGS